jgi:hypothetical protein
MASWAAPGGPSVHSALKNTRDVTKELQLWIKQRREVKALAELYHWRAITDQQLAELRAENQRLKHELSGFTQSNRSQLLAANTKARKAAA